MMDYFRKLPGFRRSPSGLEWRVLKKLPLTLLLGTALPALFLWILHSSGLADDALYGRIFIMTVSLVILFWTFMMVIGIAAFIIMLMKGPAYVADPYQSADFNDKEDEPLNRH
jgi:hypothetical protein